MIRDALITSDGVHRIWLSRLWEIAPRKTMFMHGLNPSVADGHIDDPTIRRDLGFAQREGCGNLIKTNLFEFRATDPEDLWAAPDHLRSVPGKLDWQENLITCWPGEKIVVACWGADKRAEAAGEAFMSWCRKRDIPLYCLGRTKSGAPRHPLYVRADKPLERYS